MLSPTMLCPLGHTPQVEQNDLVANNSAARSLVYEIYRYQALPEARRDTMEVQLGCHGCRQERMAELPSTPYQNP